MTDFDSIEIISNQLKDSIDYILRKKYVLENKIHPNDHDIIWFIWFILRALFQSHNLEKMFFIFNYEFSKKKKSNRV